MSAAVDFATIRETLEYGLKGSPTGGPRLESALAALDRIEADTLTAEEARELLPDARDVTRPPGYGLGNRWMSPAREALVAKLERLAGSEQ